MANSTLIVFFYIFLYISLVGALNWGLIGAFQFNLVAFVSNKKKNVENGLYIVVGFAAVITFILSLIVITSSENYHQEDEEQLQEF